MSEILRAYRFISKDGNIRYGVESEPTEYISGNRRKLSFIWDSGAFISVLSVSNFIKDTESESYQMLVESIDGEKNYIEYNSVSGGGKGVLRKIKDLTIGNLHIDEFYFLLVKDVKRMIGAKECVANVALLGSDFMDFCKFEHDIEGDFIVTGFSGDQYATYHQSYKYHGTDMVYSDMFHIQADTIG